MSNDFLRSIQTANTTTHWLSVTTNQEGQEELVQTEKTFLNRLGWGLVYIITFTIYDREKEGIMQVAFKISNIM
ncbi:MAG: hypothetical protein ACXWM7_03275, partial [Parachlamydiaceae bacterium]